MVDRETFAALEKECRDRATEYAEKSADFNHLSADFTRMADAYQQMANSTDLSHGLTVNLTNSNYSRNANHINRSMSLAMVGLIGVLVGGFITAIVVLIR